MSGRRRSHGEGSAFRRADGRWAGVLDLGWVEGKRRRRWVYGKTEKEVLDKLRALRRSAERGQDLTVRPRTLAQWLGEWLDDVKAHDGTRPATLVRYRQVVDAHLVPVLGKTRLDKLGPVDVLRLLAARREQVKPATLVKIHTVLRAALAEAERMELVSRNVAKAVRPPTLASPGRRALTVAEARLLDLVSQ